MKARSDFVSNSSSSSFIVACAAGYADKIFKEIAKSCEDKKSEWHNYGLAKRNFRILDFCVNTYQLLFLGSLFLETKKNTWTFEDFKKRWDDEECTDASLREALDKQAIDSWNDFKKSIDKAHVPKCDDEWLSREYGRDSFDAVKEEITHYEDIIAERIVVSNDVMTNTFARYHFKDQNGNELPLRKEDIDRRVANIIDLSRKQAEDHDYFMEAYHSPDIYQITQDTIDNTRELIAAGHKITFDKWEDLDSLEKKIKTGDIVFAMRVARDGDGYGDFYIYTEKESGYIEDISGLEHIVCLD